MHEPEDFGAVVQHLTKKRKRTLEVPHFAAAASFSPQDASKTNGIIRAKKSLHLPPKATDISPEKSAAPASIPLVHPLPSHVRPKTPAAAALPVWSCAAEIVQAVRQNRVTLLVGETGSGKTTQVPQLLLQTGLLRNRSLGITQPRRVAAMSLATRVNVELAYPEKPPALGKGPVGYAVRFDSQAGAETRIKFLTDGLLIREAASDPRLRHYSVIVIDEAHERTNRTDVLLGLLKLILKQRPKLRVIIMSATLACDAFARFFHECGTGVVKVPGRQYPVTIIHALHPADNRLSAVAETAVAVHLQQRREMGDLLCFLPGREEVERTKKLIEDQLKAVKEAQTQFWKQRTVLRMLREFCGGDVKKWKRLVSSILSSEKEKYQPLLNSCQDFFSDSMTDLREFVQQLKLVELGGQVPPLESLEGMQLTFRNLCIGGDLTVFDSEPSDAQEQPFLDTRVLPMYAALPLERQRAVFENFGPQVRKIILATNVAETSLTIPGVRVVVDGGECKEKVYNSLSGVDRLALRPISRASANQRSGRAGREGPGYAFRIYTHSDYERFCVQPEPEITRCDLSGVVLELKILGCRNPAEDFPFVTRPSDSAFRAAVQRLKDLGALDADGSVTDRGRLIARLPLTPELGAFLLNSVELECTAETLTLTALLSSSEGFFLSSDVTHGISKMGDHMALILAYNAWTEAKGSSARREVSTALGLHGRMLGQAKNARQQLSELLARPPFELREFSSCSWGGNEAGASTILGKCLVKSFPNRIARLQLPTSGKKGKEEKSTGQYVIEMGRQRADVHPSSSLFGVRDKPKYVVFTELVQTSKLYMRCVTPVEESWVREFHPALVQSAAAAQWKDSRPRTFFQKPRFVWHRR